MMASGVEKALRDVRKSSTSGQLKGAGSPQREPARKKKLASHLGKDKT